MERAEYLKYRSENDQSAILTAYFSDRTQQPGITIENFIQLMFMAIADDSNLQARIDEMYPQIVKYYDMKFEVNFIIRDYGDDQQVLLGTY